MNRLLLSVALIALSIATHMFLKVFDEPSSIAAGYLAEKQFENSDISSVEVYSGIIAMNWLTRSPIWILVVLLIIIWWKPMKELFKNNWLALFIAVSLFSPYDANAYFETSEKTEAYTILPNESAFWIPDTGNNKDNQGRFESEEFLQKSKIAVKRFVIPHHKLGNSGGFMGWDYYVPDGRLIIVDRTPYSREWVKSTARGTSAKDESLPCQSKEGLNVTVGISIGASVPEENAAKFLYRFGVTPPRGNRTDGNVIFTSVYYGRTLAEVMDSVVREKVQALVCQEFYSRDLDTANAEASKIITSVEKNVKDYMNVVGITLEFIGWADTFSFDPEIQNAINEVYIARTLGPHLDTLAKVRQLTVQDGIARGAEKGLPSLMNGDIVQSIMNMGHPDSGTAVLPKK